MSLAHRRAVAALPLTGAHRGLPDHTRGPHSGSSAAGGSGISHRRIAAISNPLNSHELSSLAAAFRDALAVYYYPGTWDWQHELKQSLVHKAMRRSLEDAGAVEEFERGTTLVDCYDAWAATVDDFAPVKIQHDVTALVPRPDRSREGTADPGRLGGDLRLPRRPVGSRRGRRVLGDAAPDRRRLALRGGVGARRGGHRGLLGVGAGLHRHGDRGHHPQRNSYRRRRWTSRRRIAATGRAQTGGPARTERWRPVDPAARAGNGSARLGPPGDRIEQRTAGMLRRTRIRRSRDEIAAVGSLIAAEAIEMTGAPAIYPSPGPHCLACDFRSPCLSMFEGVDPEPLLALHFRRRSGRVRAQAATGSGDMGLRQGSGAAGLVSAGSMRRHNRQGGAASRGQVQPAADGRAQGAAGIGCARAVSGAGAGHRRGRHHPVRQRCVRRDAGLTRRTRCWH